jgi:biotin carboxyl carrier protein
MSRGSRQVWVAVNGERFLVEVEDLGRDPVVAYVDGSRFEVSLEASDGSTVSEREVQPEPASSPSSIPAGATCQVTAPMPGDIVEILVAVGQTVKGGDPLCVLDAMKMKNTIHAPQGGRVGEICVQQGDAVEFGTSLFRLE